MSKKAKNNPNIKHNAKTESFKRPNHPDFWNTEECKKNKLTGVRCNRMALRWEFWILGEMAKEVTFQAVALDSKALVKAHVELFAMQPDPTIFDRKD